MPVPEGVITTTELWEQPNGNNNQTTQAQAQDGISEEAVSTTEQEVVEGGSEEQE